MTNREVVRVLRKAGPVFVQALVREDTRWIEAVKADVLFHAQRDVERDGPDAEACWTAEHDGKAIYVTPRY